MDVREEIQRLRALADHWTSLGLTAQARACKRAADQLQHDLDNPPHRCRPECGPVCLERFREAAKAMRGAA